MNVTITIGGQSIETESIDSAISLLTLLKSAQDSIQLDPAYREQAFAGHAPKVVMMPAEMWDGLTGPCGYTATGYGREPREDGPR